MADFFREVSCNSRLREESICERSVGALRGKVLRSREGKESEGSEDGGRGKNFGEERRALGFLEDRGEAESVNFDVRDGRVLERANDELQDWYELVGEVDIEEISVG